MKINTPLRILHVVGGMNTGGVETWLMHILRHLDQARFSFDFLVHTSEKCFFDDEIRSLGGNIIRCPRPCCRNIIDYSIRLLQALRYHGPYDIIHSHIHYFSGYVLMLARFNGVSKRIAHSHNNLRDIEKQSRFLRKIYCYGMKSLIQLNATDRLGCSRDAATSLFGKNWGRDSRQRVIFCGIDFELFSKSIESKLIRRDLGIPAKSCVMGHVGRFDEQKNHSFLIDIFKEFLQCKSDARLLLVGDGLLREAIEKKIYSYGIQEFVIFAGTRSDVPLLLKGAMDVMVFPSLHEGLPLTLIEAQAAGLPILCSDIITDQIDIYSSVIVRKSLRSNASEWASETIRILEENKCTPNVVDNFNRNNPFSIKKSYNHLAEIYNGVLFRENV
jgi:glycosyltransferase involved in cell wall biosynthesis